MADDDLSVRLRAMPSADLDELAALARDREREEEEIREGRMIRGETWAEQEARIAANADPATGAEFDRMLSDTAPAGSNGARAAGREPVAGLVSSVLSRVAQERPGLPEEELWALARGVSEALGYEHRRRLARRLADDDDASRAMSLQRARAVTADRFLAERATPTTPCLGGLVGEGHNAVIVAQYKAGKTTVLEVAALALVTATPFLGIFDVTHPYRVAFANYELTEDDARDRLRHLGMTPEQLERLLLLNLRGVGLSLTTPTGRRWLTARLQEHRTEVALLDTYGAASAPSVESENDNAGARRWLMTWDAIKTEAGVHTSVISHHTGRAQHNEGEEHGRGATVLDDWADVRLILTRDRATGQRFLASEGRSSYSLPESKLMFDPATRLLTLTESNLGENRKRAREAQAAEQVAEIVTRRRGINTTALRQALHDAHMTNGGDQSAAISTARQKGLVHPHKGKGNSACHYLGADHPDETPCPDPTYTPENA